MSRVVSSVELVLLPLVLDQVADPVLDLGKARHEQHHQPRPVAAARGRRAQELPRLRRGVDQRLVVEQERDVGVDAADQVAPPPPLALAEARGKDQRQDRAGERRRDQPGDEADVGSGNPRQPVQH